MDPILQWFYVFICVLYVGTSFTSIICGFTIYNTYVAEEEITKHTFYYQNTFGSIAILSLFFMLFFSIAMKQCELKM